jgi:hypothetical protein
VVEDSDFARFLRAVLVALGWVNVGRNGEVAICAG